LLTLINFQRFIKYKIAVSLFLKVIQRIAAFAHRRKKSTACCLNPFSLGLKRFFRLVGIRQDFLAKNVLMTAQRDLYRSKVFTQWYID